MFISDNELRKTFDPDRNIGLVLEKIYREGERRFRLECCGELIWFVTPLPRKHDFERDSQTIHRHVQWNGVPLKPFTSQETKQIIREALESFKSFYGKRPQDTIMVHFLNNKV